MISTTLFHQAERPAAAADSGNRHAGQSPEAARSCGGYCLRCQRQHFLGEGPARRSCLSLMEQLAEKKRIDLTVGHRLADPRLSTDYLFGPARGQMFGVLAFRRADGSCGAIPAFSGQYNGQWLVDGWAPPLFAPEAFTALSNRVDPVIKDLGRQLAAHEKGSGEWTRIRAARKGLSQQLMKDLHGLYAVTNFRGQQRSLPEIYRKDKGIPTGTGDCCAPKLLHFAAVNKLHPLGIAEFFWGRENLSKTREHGQFYPSCPEKCEPILGYMLCGLEADAPIPE